MRIAFGKSRFRSFCKEFNNKEGYTMTLGENIKRAYRAIGFDNIDFGYALNVSEDVVNRLESGDAVPDIKMICKIAHTLEVSIDFLLEGTDKNVFSQKEVAILRAYRSKPEMQNKVDDALGVPHKLTMPVEKTFYDTSLFEEFDKATEKQLTVGGRYLADIQAYDESYRTVKSRRKNSGSKKRKGEK